MNITRSRTSNRLTLARPAGSSCTCIAASVLRLATLLLVSITSQLASAEPTFHDVFVNLPVSDGKPVTDKADTDKPLQLRLTALGRDFNLVLSESSITNGTRFLDHAGEDAQPPLKLASDLQLLSGTLVEDSSSWARLSLQDDLLTGYIKAYGELWKIERSANLKATGKGLHLQTPTAIVRVEELLTEIIGSSSIATDLIRHVPIGPQSPANVNRLQVAAESVRVPRAARIGLVIDSLFNEHHQFRGVEHALSLMNAIDGIFQDQLGIAIILDTVRDYTDPLTDPMRDKGGTIEEILENFRNVRIDDSQLRSDLTLVHLFSGLRDPDGVIGLGWINTACRLDGFDVSVSTPFAFDALLAAHEMAHNLGALHDDDPSCSTDRTNIMWPRLSSHTVPSFSQCSIDAIMPTIGLSCNVDNLDLSAGVQSSPNSVHNSRKVTLLVRNNDPSRTAENVSIVAGFPIDSVIADAPGVCLSAGQQLRCNFGNLAPLTTASALITLTLAAGDSKQLVTVRTITDQFVDIRTDNNTSTLDVRGFGNTSSANTSIASDDASNTSVAPAESSVNITTIAGSQPSQVSGGTSGDGLGSYGLFGLAVLLLLAVQRRVCAGSISRWDRF